MKKFSTKIKYLSFIFALVIGALALSHNASADTYWYTCPGGGGVQSDVSLNPGSAPYTFGSNQTFNATGQIHTIGCKYVSQVNLKVHNNFGPDVDLIPDTSATPNQDIPWFFPATVSFTTPSTVCSGFLCPYAAYFVTGVNDTAPTATITSAYALAGPVQGGTNNTNVYCQASADAMGVSGSVDITYQYVVDTNGVPGNAGTDYCTVGIDPATGNGSSYPGKEYFQGSAQNVNVTSSCWTNSTLPVDPSIPHC